jgi:hypothetical protein
MNAAVVDTDVVLMLFEGDSGVVRLAELDRWSIERGLRLCKPKLAMIVGTLANFMSAWIAGILLSPNIFPAGMTDVD